MLAQLGKQTPLALHHLVPPSITLWPRCPLIGAAGSESQQARTHTQKPGDGDQHDAKNNDSEALRTAATLTQSLLERVHAR